MYLILLYKKYADYLAFTQISLFDIFLVFVSVILMFLLIIYFKEKLTFNNTLLKKFIAYIFFTRMAVNIFFTLIYTYYYNGGGDTTVYYSNAKVFGSLLINEPSLFFSILFESPSIKNYLYFNNETLFPTPDLYFDPHVFNMFKLTAVFALLSFGSYITGNLLVGFVSLFPLLKIFQLISKRYPAIKPKILFSFFFLPSVLFWGTAILKDTFTYTSLIILVYSLLNLLEGKNKIKYIIYTTLAGFLIISIKPYLLLSLIPAILFLVLWQRVVKVKSIVAKIVIVPVVTALGLVSGYYLFSLMSPLLGVYGNIDSVVDKAYNSYNDLKQAYYKGNSFDLGYYDPTLQGMLSKFDVAVVAGLFRPFIWEAKNPLMILSGLENLYLLGFTVYALLKTRLKFFATIFADNYLMFCFVFSIILAFSIAISTSNFGALVRFKIPLIPFYTSMLFIIMEKNKKRVYVQKKQTTPISMVNIKEVVVT